MATVSGIPVVNPFLSIPMGNTIERISSSLVCDYCGQLHTEDDFLGGCKSCGAPAPRMMANVPRYQMTAGTDYGSNDYTASVTWRTSF